MRHFFGFCANASGPKVATVFPAPRKPVRIVTGTCRAKLATEGKGDSTHKNHLLPIILQQASCNSPIAGIPPCLQTRLLLRAIRLHFCKLAGRHAAGGWLMMAWICGAITGVHARNEFMGSKGAAWVYCTSRLAPRRQVNGIGGSHRATGITCSNAGIPSPMQERSIEFLQHCGRIGAVAPRNQCR